MATSKKQTEKGFTPWEEMLKDAIKGSGMTLVEIAERSKVSCSQLSRFCTGKRKQIALSTAEKIAAVVGLELKAKKARR